MKLFRPLPTGWSRPLTILIVSAWVVQMGLLLRETFASAAPVALAADLARYGSSAQWRGVYYRGEKIGFTVSQTVTHEDGYEIQEDGQLQLNLMGATTASRHTTRARVDRGFGLRSFSFALDPGTGPISVAGALRGAALDLTISTPAGERNESRQLPEPPHLALNLSRRLAAAGLEPGQVHELSIFDPATLSNAPMRVTVEARELVRVLGRPVPAVRVRTEMAGIETRSWITDVGEVVREESAMGLVVIKEGQDRATALGLPGGGIDMLRAAAVVPKQSARIDDPRAVRRLRVRLEGVSLAAAELDGAGQTSHGDGVVEVVDSRERAPRAADPAAARFLDPEPLIESDDPEIRAEALRAVAGAEDQRGRAERLVRHVNALLEKKPTVAIPSAREVLRTRVGDCNEHTALYVAMARAAGIPARIAVGLVHLHGAFYYHAWPEVYLAEPSGRGLWLPVDPTLNEFPADATHLRLALGGLDRQAEIVGYLGRLELTVLELELGEEATPILIGKEAQQQRLPMVPLLLPDRPGAGSCWSRP